MVLSWLDRRYSNNEGTIDSVLLKGGYTVAATGVSLSALEGVQIVMQGADFGPHLEMLGLGLAGAGCYKLGSMGYRHVIRPLARYFRNSAARRQATGHSAGPFRFIKTLALAGAGLAALFIPPVDGTLEGLADDIVEVLGDEVKGDVRMDQDEQAGTVPDESADSIDDILEDKPKIAETKPSIKPVMGCGSETAEAEDPETELEEISDSQFEVEVKHSKFSDKGKAERTARYDRKITELEDKYGMPAALFAGLIMTEGEGDPTRLNRSNKCRYGDGGAGLAQFQPGTARSMGLKTYGRSRATGRDCKHGEELYFLKKRLNSDLGKLAAADERFHPDKALEASARYLDGLRRQGGDWDTAVCMYNRGKKSRCPHPKRVRHNRKVYYNQDVYLRLKNELSTARR